MVLFSEPSIGQRAKGATKCSKVIFGEERRGKSGADQRRSEPYTELAISFAGHGYFVLFALGVICCGGDVQLLWGSM